MNEQLLIRDYGSTFAVYLHWNQRNLGRVYIASHRPEIRDLFQIDDRPSQEKSVTPERLLFFLIGQQVCEALKLAFRSDGFEYFAARTAEDTFAMQILPRYNGKRHFANRVFVDHSITRTHYYDSVSMLTDEEYRLIRDEIVRCLEIVRAGRP